MVNRDYFAVTLKYIEELWSSLEKRQIDNARSLVKIMSSDREFCAFVSLYVGTIGEYSNKFPDEFKTAHPQINWSRLYRTRNIIAHDYDAANFAVIAGIVFEQIEPLKSLLQLRNT